MYLCVCKGIRVSDAVEAAKSGVVSIEALISSYNFDDETSCGRCARYKQEIVTLIRIELNKPVTIPSNELPEAAKAPIPSSPHSSPHKHRGWFRGYVNRCVNNIMGRPPQR